MDRIIELPRNDRWQSMARASIREDLYAAHAALTGDVLSVGNGTSTPEERFAAWEDKNAAILTRSRTTLEEIRGRTRSIWRTCRWPCGPCGRCCVRTGSGLRGERLPVRPAAAPSLIAGD